MKLLDRVVEKQAAHNLFDRPAVIEWLPNETIFSLASRHHWLSGNSTPSRTCVQLFGDARTGSAHDFPARVDQLVSRSEGALGSASDIILRHSILPLYLPFHSLQRRANWLRQMQTGAASQLKADLGVLASRYGGAHPLKACAACVEEDARTHHVAYWHVHHQLPGVWLCPFHKLPLLVANLKWRGPNRFGWLLPGQAEWSAQASEIREESIDHLMRFAEAAIALWSLPPAFQFRAARLHRCYQLAMNASGCRSARGRVDSRAFKDLIESALAPLHGIDEFAGLTANMAKASARFLRYTALGSPRDCRHPVNHLVLTIALFGTWAAFWEKYIAQDDVDDSDRDGRNDSECDADTPAADAIDVRKVKFLSLLGESGESVSSMARQSGVAVGTAMHWAAEAGLESRRRPKVLKEQLRAALITELKRGIDKSTAASLGQVSVQTITRLLFTEPGLHEAWEGARFAKAKTDARRAWQQVVRRFPETSSANWRALKPAAYAWLYRNDRAWLQQSIQSRLHPPPKPTTPVQWDQRDVGLAQTIRSAANTWCQTNPGQRLTIAALCCLIPSLKARLSALGKLPLTRRALTDISGRKLRSASSRSLWSEQTQQE